MTVSTRIVDELTIPTPGAFAIDVAHTHVGFVARHLVVSKVRGSFGEVSGTITVAEDPQSSAADVTIGAASISTGSADRDAHLRSADFLDVETYPNLTFRSTRVVRQSGSRFTLAGDLTIRDVTREVELAVEYDGVVDSPWGAQVVAFTASTEIDREAFGITWNQALEAGGFVVGKHVKVEIAIEAVRQG